MTAVLPIHRDTGLCTIRVQRRENIVVHPFLNPLVALYPLLERRNKSARAVKIGLKLQCSSSYRTDSVRKP